MYVYVHMHVYTYTVYVNIIDSHIESRNRVKKVVPIWLWQVLNIVNILNNDDNDTQMLQM